MKFVTINIGSRSKKYTFFENDTKVCVRVYADDAQNVRHEIQKDIEMYDPSVASIRIVAPGRFFRNHHVIDASFLKQLELAQNKAPLHIMPTLEEIHFLQTTFPHIRCVGISDSAFHASVPDYARLYAISEADTVECDVERFGYHGVSLSSIVETLKKNATLPEKLVVCHLGGGSSVTAIHNGVSVDTTMGYSPVSGLPMATRVGDIDTQAVMAIAAIRHYELSDIEKYVMNKCGFLGMAGTADMKTLLAQERVDHRAAHAVNMFVYQIQKHIGAYHAVLGGIDMLVFSGGIGEASEIIRQKIMEKLQHYVRNAQVVPTQEDEEMIRLTKSYFPSLL